MKRFINNIVAILLFTFAGYACSAVEVNHQAEVEMKLIPVGVISVSNQYTMDEIDLELKIQAEKAGASFYRVTSISGKNKMHATAIIFK